MDKVIGFEARFWMKKCPTARLYNLIKNKVDITEFDVISPENVNSNWDDISININESYNIWITKNDTGEAIEISSINQITVYISFELKIERIDYLSLISELLDIDGLLTIHIYDYNDVYWQSVDTTQSYIFANKPYSHLLIVEDPLGIGRECLDTSKNYGRFVSLYRDRTMAAPINYYGTMFFNLIPKEYIANYSGFYKFEEYKRYIKCVLFFEIFESDKNRKKQEEYFKYLKIQELSDLIGDIYGINGVPFDKEIDVKIKQLYSP